MPDGTSTLDHFGAGFTLVAWDDADTNELVAAAAQLAIPLRTLEIDDPATKMLYEMPLVLVRPDGHVCWRGGQRAAAGGSVLDVLRTVAGFLGADNEPGSR